MGNPTYMLKHLTTILNLGIVCEEKLKLTSYMDDFEHHPLYTSETLRKLLVENAKNQTIPYIYKDDYSVYFGCVRDGDSFYLVGPMSIELLSRAKLHQFYKEYEISVDNEKWLKRYSFSEILDIIEIIAHFLLGVEYEDNDLIYANKLVTYSRQLEEREQIIFKMKSDDEELYHHTYKEERRLLDSVREGRVQEAIRLNRKMDTDMGKLSLKELNHWKNVAIVGITLCTRASIEGGVSPAVAYRISDFYIQKCDGCGDIVQLLEYRNHAVEEFARRVLEKKSRKTSSYVEQCKDYVSKYYRNKIYLEEIANKLGISDSYLSRLFKKECGISLQDYIVYIRLEHAKNLLKYSEESISNIAEYVNFPSQSYFGKKFKDRYHISPKKYRETNRPTEYFGKKE